MGKKRAEPPPPAQGPFHDAFARLRERLPPGWTPPAAAAPPLPPAAEQDRGGGRGPRGPARAVVRIERKGRAGKEATVVEKLGLDAATLERWVADARRALGCGGAVEDGALVLQGDQRERVARWLEARGVAKVTVAG